MKIFQDMKDTGASGQVTNVVSQLRFRGEDVFDHRVVEEVLRSLLKNLRS